VRTKALVQLVGTVSLSIASVACSGQHASDAAASPLPSPSPLQSCETRELTLDGTDLIVQANADGTAASIVVVRAADDDARTKALDNARHIFGEPHPDAQTVQRTNKWGLTSLTDPCGRPVSPKPQ